MDVSPNTIRQFIFYQKEKFKIHGSCYDRVPGSRRPQEVTGNKKIVKKVLATFVEKNTHSQRNVAKNLDISRSSIQNILKNNGIMALHKIREQAMSVGHKMDRVKYGKWLLKNLGQDGS